MNEQTMTFEERMALKQRSGFDHIKTKEDVLMRREQADKLKSKAVTAYTAANRKKMPKTRYSKLPVSIIRPLNLESMETKQAPKTRDPRFDNLSGNLNEGLFQESYSFVKDIRNERIGQLNDYITQAKRVKKQDGTEKMVKQLREMLGEEKDALNKGQQRRKDKEILKEVKQENRDRAVKGLEPKFYKKRELKDLRHKEKFDKLEKEGKLKDFVEKKQVETDKRRVQR